ncbi:hypothetical protein BDN71DRAFT_1482594 [Pleurotus eryngii]|uniref:Protein kinase domain-containing protein n=1 Tax=Pleurotus eryngii TaxID=5323 RepID=A0A9P6A1M4_PLEER|nr:hypothetical protein BDN71DRAFT_1482594 [Pleurotus eryngii]
MPHPLSFRLISTVGKSCLVKADIQLHVDNLMERPSLFNNIGPYAIWWPKQYKFPVGILELKHTYGISGDPFVQSLVDYTKILAPFQGACNFPALLTGLLGNRLEVGMAVCIGLVCTSRLVAFDVIPSFHLHNNILHVAHIFKCLFIKGNLMTTSAIYPNAERGIGLCHQCNPSSTGAALLHLMYHGLPPSGDHILNPLPCSGSVIRTTLLYQATLHTGNSTTEVVIKFTSRYGKATHHLPSNAALVQYSIMEYLADGVLLWCICAEPLKRRPVPDALFDDVEKALDLLHKHGLVFGDVQDANLVLSKGCRFLVDFDWAGREGEDRYPVVLNVANGWHPEVCVYAIMRMIHDDFQFEQLKPQL